MECIVCQKKIDRDCKICPYCRSNQHGNNDTEKKEITKQLDAISLRNKFMRISNTSDYRTEFDIDFRNKPNNYIKNDYYEYSNIIVFDKATNLIWQKKGSNLVNYDSGIDFIKSLNKFKYAGIDSWRIPTVPELMSLLEPYYQNEDLHIDPLFSYTQKYSWSSDLAYDGKAWYANFTTGTIDWYEFGGTNYVRAVSNFTQPISK